MKQAFIFPVTEKLYRCKVCRNTKMIETNHYGNCYSAGPYNVCKICPPSKRPNTWEFAGVLPDLERYNNYAVFCKTGHAYLSDTNEGKMLTIDEFEAKDDAFKNRFKNETTKSV